MIAPGIYTLPPGADFPTQLATGLRNRLCDAPPEAMARVTLILSTARMRKRVTEAFIRQGATLLPRLRLLGELADDPALDLPPAMPPLRRRLELAQLVARLLTAQPDLAPRSATFDLADSLAALAEEMEAEGVPAERLLSLDLTGHSAHWARTMAFLRIIAPQLTDLAQPDPPLRQVLAIDRLIRRWESRPPADPILLAGSTGSRGSTARLMTAIAGLPAGGLILPGFDPDLPDTAWEALSDSLTSEDHPQFRFRRLADRLGLHPRDFQPWTADPPPSPPRNRLISLALRPAPVTDRWLAEGPELPELTEATADLTLIEAPSPRAEALAIALILREAAQNGTKTALITPYRTLARQVTAMLDRWGIRPDDSAGRPLDLSTPGRFLRHVADLPCQRLSADRLLVLLKHPLAASGGARGPHLRLTRAYELHLRRYGPAFPTATDIRHWASQQTDPEAPAWAAFLTATLPDAPTEDPLPLVDHVTRHRHLAEALARGTAPEGAGLLWENEAGEACRAALDNLASEAAHGGEMTATEYRDLIQTLVLRGELRETELAHPTIMIWGTVEARVQGADLVILGGLNDGTWPVLPPPDPWLNRALRKEAGLLLPERRIGLSAHDFQQAIAAPRVVLTRALRDAEAECIPSRWLNRLTNLMQGLPGRNGPQALAAMRARGQSWLALADRLETPDAELTANPALAPAARPAPQPPVAHRPRRLPLTGIARLIRDPYAIYARHILRLYPLDPLHPTVDARDRGTVFHIILEHFVKDRPPQETPPQARARLLQTGAQVLARDIPFPSIRAVWLARLTRAADHILTQDRRLEGEAMLLETPGALRLDTPDFTLFGTPDRIDRLPDGRLHLIDYKTGTPPSEPQQKKYEKQLLLAAAMAERGGFPDLGPIEVDRITFVGLGSGEKAVETQLKPGQLDAEWARFLTLITRYHQRDTGYTARRAVFEDRFRGDYDQLSRYGEWLMSDRAQPQPVGPPSASEEPQDAS